MPGPKTQKYRARFSSCKDFGERGCPNMMNGKNSSSGSKVPVTTLIDVLIIQCYVIEMIKTNNKINTSICT